MKTLAAVLAKAQTSGDIVYAAEGVYSDKTMEVSGVSTKDNGLCRAVLAEGVTLQASGRKEKTVILGAKATSSLWNDCGTDSVRCVYLNKEAKLVGFTVTGGHARYASTSNYAYGGGVYCVAEKDKMAIVSDCIVSNNWTYGYGGGGYNGCWLRCRVVGNFAQAICSGVGGMDVARLYDCYINDNVGYNNNCVQVYCPRYVVNTTLGASEKMLTVSAYDAHKSVFCNCVFLSVNCEPSVSMAYRCAFDETIADVQSWIAKDPGSSFATNAAALAIGADGRISRASCLIDAGLKSYRSTYLPTGAEAGFDIDGRVRVLGREVDIGAAEYDLKDDPLDGLGRVMASAASATVRPQGADGIALPTGTEATVVSARSSNPQTRTVFSAEVTGSGTLTIYANGSTEPWQTLTSASGRTDLSRTETGDLTLRFAFTGGDDASEAVVSGFSNCAYARIAADSGLVTVTGASVGLNEVSVDGSLSFSITRTFQKGKIATGVSVNGEFRSFETDAPDGKTFSFTVTDADRASSVDIVVVYETPTTYAWYVADQGGNDGNTGVSRFDAFKTLKRAMENADLRSGETVWVLPGTYDDGTMTATTDPISMNSGSNGLCRVAVKDGVTLRSTEGPEKTVILGAKATETLWGDGCGVDSVRCVYLAPATKLIGFTLTGGRAYYNSTTDHGYGGGVYSTYYFKHAQSDSYALVADCIISNNSAYAHGGGLNGRYVRCRIVGNSSGNKVSTASSGVGGRNAFWLYDCYINGNTGTYQANQPGNGCVNVTFGPDGGTPLVSDQYQGNRNYYNCLFLGTSSPITYTASGLFCGHNCVFADTIPGATDFIGTANEYNCRVLSAEKIALGADGRPLKQSELVDTGSNELHSAYITSRAEAGGDASVSVPRILNNNRIDVGAFEYDWRTDYAKDLTKRAVVTDVSSAVAETADAKVRLTDGTVLETKIAYKAGAQARVPFSFAISGTGTLTITVDGVVAGTFTADDTVWNHRTQKAVETVVFSYAGDGFADIGKVADGLGLMLLVR